MGTTYRNLHRPEHLLADGRGFVGEHRMVLFDKIGYGPHLCHWCSRPVNWGRGNGAGVLNTDHLDSMRRHNVPENLVPSCHGCNCVRERAGHYVADDELFVLNGRGHRVRAEERACKTCGRAFLVAKAEAAVPGRGLFCSRVCFYQGRRSRWAS